MKPLYPVNERNVDLTVSGYKTPTWEYFVLTSVKGIKAIATREEAAEAIKLGKFKVDNGNGKWDSCGPSSWYTPNPHWLKLKNVQRFVKYEMYVNEPDPTFNADDDSEDAVESFDNSPEYVHDIALDWLYEHAEEYDSEEEVADACKNFLSTEGYNVSNPDCEQAVRDALDDFYN